MNKLKPGVESEHRRDHREFERPSERGDDLAADYIGESKQRYCNVGIVFGEIPYVALDLIEASFNRVSQRKAGL